MAKTVAIAQIIPCQLMSWDPSGETTVWIRQARSDANAERERITHQFEVIRESGRATREVYRLPGHRQMALECWLTFVDANIEMELPDPKDKSKTTQGRGFQKGMGEADFMRVFGTLPDDLVEDWHAHVLLVNPQWDLSRRAELADTFREHSPG